MISHIWKPWQITRSFSPDQSWWMIQRCTRWSCQLDIHFPMSPLFKRKDLMILAIVAKEHLEQIDHMDGSYDFDCCQHIHCSSWLPSGKRTKNYGTSSFWMGKSTIYKCPFSIAMLVYQKVSQLSLFFTYFGSLLFPRCYLTRLIQTNISTRNHVSTDALWPPDEPCRKAAPKSCCTYPIADTSLYIYTHIYIYIYVCVCDYYHYYYVYIYYTYIH